MVITVTHNGNIFSPFFLSVDCMLGKEALVILTNLTRLMAAKLDKSFSHVRGWVNAQIAIMVTKSYYCMIHRAFPPSTLQYREPY